MNSPQKTLSLVCYNGCLKVQKSWYLTFINAVLGGMFIALWAMFFVTAMVWITEIFPYGVAKVIGGVVFCLWLILCVLTGAELYTGNALLIVAKAEKRITLFSWIKNLILVRFWNLWGSLLIIMLLFFSFWHGWADGMIGKNLLDIAQSKLLLSPLQTLCAWVLCNLLVCLAIWIATIGKTVVDKIFGILFPITAFVAAGFEHVVANMFYLPYAYLLAPKLSMTNFTLFEIFIHNFLPVTLGNFIWGTFFVGLIYWFLYKDRYVKISS